MTIPITKSVCVYKTYFARCGVEDDEVEEPEEGYAILPVYGLLMSSGFCFRNPSTIESYRILSDMKQSF